jgi:hypothetical protein
MTVTTKFSMPNISATTESAPTLAAVQFEGVTKHMAISTTFHVRLNKKLFILQVPITCCCKATSFSKKSYRNFWENKVRQERQKHPPVSNKHADPHWHELLPGECSAIWQLPALYILPPDW